MAGQSLTEIRALLEAAGLSPRHRFGQNFLIDLNLMRKLVAAAEVGPGDVVLEVGPGTGSLSELLLEAGAAVVAVEIDRGLHRLLSERFGNQPRCELIHGDALDGKHALNAEAVAALERGTAAGGGQRKLVANLPYQIATPLLINLLHMTPPIERMTCTIQKEVGERLMAEPRGALYGPVSVVIQTLATVRTVAHLPPSVFWPPPKVDSVMLDIVPHRCTVLSPEESFAFVQFVQRGFQQRRKMLRRALADWPADRLEQSLAAAGVSLTQRPEELSPSQWVRLFQALGGPRQAR